MANPTAYAVGFINKQTHVIEGVAVFSEESPTTNLSKYFTVVMFTEWGDNYHEADERAHKAFHDNPAYQWMRPLLRERTGP